MINETHREIVKMTQFYQMARYDAMDAMRVWGEWTGATAKAFGEHPMIAMTPNPLFAMIGAWGRVTERSFSRIDAKPDWRIGPITGAEGQDHIVRIKPVLSKPFGDLIHFEVARREPVARKILIVAPMSGHYATLLRPMVASLVPEAEVYVTEWRNARDVPISEGDFDIERYTEYLIEFFKHLGPEINVIAVCQPAPLSLAATAYLSEHEPEAAPRTLTLIGGPIDPDAAATEVTDFGNRITMGQLEAMSVQRVGLRYAGARRMVYPGLLQLSSFIAMNAQTHAKAFQDQILAEAHGKASEDDRHNRFYDEYLAVMDIPAEFYLSTVERIFKGNEVGRNAFTLRGVPIDAGKITHTAVMTVEGEDDDISAPGQCVAALDLCSGLPDDMKAQHLEPGAGHYGIFAGKSWRINIRPVVLDFIDEGAKGPQRRKRGGVVMSDPSPADSPIPTDRVAI